jgi:hypothetical protein
VAQQQQQWAQVFWVLVLWVLLQHGLQWHMASQARNCRTACGT